MTLAPIVLFVYNRPWHTEQTLTALAQNDLSNDSELYIFCDGPKDFNDSSEARSIAQVYEVITKKKWCKNVYIETAESNMGLAKSIVSGVTKIIKEYGRIIVLEDDIVTSKGFLKFMNDTLRLYENDEKVMHVSGYMYPLEIKRKGICFLNVVTPWGWATWHDRWKQYDNNPIDLKNELHKSNFFSEFDFNKGFGTEFTKQLNANIDGTLNTWAIKWHTSIYLKQGYCLHPLQSLVRNIGFDNSGEHCGNSNEYNVDVLVCNVKVNRIAIKEDKEILLLFENYYNRLSIVPKYKIKTFHRIKSIIKRIINN